MPGELKAIADGSLYRIQRKLAEGGMGTVYEAMQEGAQGFAKRVAIKTLVPRFMRHPQVVEMFVHEAKLVADLVHENIVQIYQLGQSEDEGYYIVMEFVRGLSLYDFTYFHTAVQAPMPRHLAVFIVSRVARGLAYAHTRRDNAGHPLNIVHRDVCPNNILITTEGLPKLTDFGIAAAKTARPDMQQSLLGKLAYMSPEQARRELPDFRADQFSLGAVLFEMLAGRPIRQAASEAELQTMAEQGEVMWDVLPNDLAPELMGILRRCLAPRADDRYVETSELARELEYFIYKDGYGPTIQTLEAYLKHQFPYLYQFHAQRGQFGASPHTPTPLEPTRKMTATLIMDT